MAKTAGKIGVECHLFRKSRLGLPKGTDGVGHDKDLANTFLGLTAFIVIDADAVGSKGLYPFEEQGLMSQGSLIPCFVDIADFFLRSFR